MYPSYIFISIKMFKNGKSHIEICGDLIPVLPGIQYIQLSQRRSQMLNFLHRGPVTFNTLVYDTKVEDISPLDMYYNPAVFSLWKLNNLLPHVRPRILKPNEAEEVLRHGLVGFGWSGSKILNPESWLRNGGHSTQDQVMQMGRRLSQGRPSQSQPEPFRDMVATNKGTLDPESTINTGESKRRIGLQ